MWLNYSNSNEKWINQTKSYIFLLGLGFNFTSPHSNRNIDSNVIEIPVFTDISATKSAYEWINHAIANQNMQSVKQIKHEKHDLSINTKAYR